MASITGAPDQIIDDTLRVLDVTRKLTFPGAIHDKVFLGFDGYVDSILSVIRDRQSMDTYHVMKKMSEWAARIDAASGSSASIERVTKRVTTGGFTCNVGKALSALCGRPGNVHLVGAFGYPSITPVFNDILAGKFNCQLESIWNPGMTDAYEFSDGKIMMVSFDEINKLDWDSIVKRVGHDCIVHILDESNLWGLNYWPSSPHMSGIYEGLARDVLPSLSRPARAKHLLLDLSDLKKKPAAEIRKFPPLVSTFEDHVQTVLLMNDKELNDLVLALKNEQPGSILPGEMEKATRYIRDTLDISLVIAHAPRLAALSGRGGKDVAVVNAFTPHPRYTTSAGDHFTAGVGFGLLQGVEAGLLPLLGNLTTSIFVRTGDSPGSQDVKNFIDEYEKNVVLR